MAAGIEVAFPRRLVARSKLYQGRTPCWQQLFTPAKTLPTHQLSARRAGTDPVGTELPLLTFTL
jgi:hypothetical protein